MVSEILIVECAFYGHVAIEAKNNATNVCSDLKHGMQSDWLTTSRIGYTAYLDLTQHTEETNIVTCRITSITSFHSASFSCL